ncbi:MAG: Histidyl-tRNA synthetase [Candidatus Daviesbacteria bacterium GW2011_GWA1_36_8]|uniref:histidine--tRNA ligase n=1 Tax=Candidatus Daviesbacteria bacterium GW2011_GWA1_36_8 TaxID=1618417 RepID=A0A0G0FAV0_9BACT|nr:MAG: Histidyl-tRNA synthetase [Candidatus Daviesbacteria bacterium GW2011_GWA1_36_8]
MNIKASTPKGFRDYLPADAIARQVVLEKIQKVFQKFGFDPLETPTLEFEETLTGKYGEEEKLIYKFETPGGDKVALKYDQTVGENPQKGRYRQFLQCDGDIIGISSPLADAEILALTYEIYSELGLDVVIKINDRALIADVEPKFLAAIDKLGKIGEVGVLEELQQKGLSSNEASELLSKVKILKPTQKLDQIITFYKGMGYPEGSLQFDPALIRGLDYYTGLILEVVLKSDPNSSSLAGGGRWDSLIGKFTGMDLAAIGFAIGVDRTIEAMESLGVLDAGKTSSKVLVTIFSEQLQNKSLEISSRLRSNKIPTELWLDPEAKLEKQLKYADQKGIPYALIIGPDEAEKDMVNLKNLTTKTQETLTLDEVIQKLTS